MKPLTQNRIFLSDYKFQPLRECLRRFYGHCLLSVRSVLVHVNQTLTEKLKNSRMMDALLTYRAGRVAVTEAWTNKRFRVGVCVGLVALPAWKCYLFFDINTEIEGFYFVNWVYFLHQIRWQLAGIFISLGGFIALPTKVGFRWVSLPIFLFCATEIYQISGYDHYTDFYKAMPDWQIVTLILSCALAIHLSANYLIYRKYHLKDGNAARLTGILMLPIPWEEKRKHMEKLLEEMENYNSRI
jgi:hypothetical protein